MLDENVHLLFFSICDIARNFCDKIDPGKTSGADLADVIKVDLPDAWRHNQIRDEANIHCVTLLWNYLCLFA